MAGPFLVMLAPDVRERGWRCGAIGARWSATEWRPQLERGDPPLAGRAAAGQPGFLASEFIMEQELPALIERGVRLCPVLVRECLWERCRSWRAVQWAHDPERDGPLADSRPRDRDDRADLREADRAAAVPAGSAPVEVGDGEQPRRR